MITDEGVELIGKVTKSVEKPVPKFNVEIERRDLSIFESES